MLYIVVMKGVGGSCVHRYLLCVTFAKLYVTKQPINADLLNDRALSFLAHRAVQLFHCTAGGTAITAEETEKPAGHMQARGLFLLVVS